MLPLNPLRFSTIENIILRCFEILKFSRFFDLPHGHGMANAMAMALAMARARARARADGRADGRTDGRADGRADGRPDGRAGGRAEGQSHLFSPTGALRTFVTVSPYLLMFWSHILFNVHVEEDLPRDPHGQASSHS